MFQKIFYKWISLLWFLLSVLFVYAPVIVMIVFSFNKSESCDHWEGFSLQWYKVLFSSEEMTSALTGSLLVGLFATLLSVGLALLVVVASRWWNPWWLLKLFVINISIPELFLAVAVLNVFVVLGVPTGFLSLVSGHTLLGFGVAVPWIHSAFLDVNRALIDSSFDLGATYLQTFRYVLLPVLKPVLVSASFMVFTLSLDDFFINFFCSGVGFNTVSTHVYTTIKAVVDPSLNALSSTLFFISFVLVFLLSVSSHTTNWVFGDD